MHRSTRLREATNSRKNALASQPRACAGSSAGSSAASRA